MFLKRAALYLFNLKSFNQFLKTIFCFSKLNLKPSHHLIVFPLLKHQIVSVKYPNFILSLPFCSFQFPFISVVFILLCINSRTGGTNVKLFSLCKGQINSSTNHYTFFEKSCIIHTCPNLQHAVY